MSRVRVPLSAHSKVAPWPQQKWCVCCGSAALPKVSRTSSAAWRRIRECGHHNGLWRSLVALPLWVREVAGSNPASPTTLRDSEGLALVAQWIEQQGRLSPVLARSSKPEVHNWTMRVRVSPGELKLKIKGGKRQEKRKGTLLRQGLFSYVRWITKSGLDLFPTVTYN